MARAGLTALALLVVATGAVAAPCVGRFVVTRATGALVAGPGDAVVLDGASAVVDPACGSASVRARTPRRLAARWSDCRGRRVLRLALRESADCTLLRGIMSARGARPSRFVAIASRCGDGVVDGGAGEGCDDGNTLAGDGCDATCGRCVDPSTLPTTWAAIQANVFDHACASCHGASATAGLDVRGPDAYARVVGVPAAGGLFRVAPGAREASLIWRKLAKATFGDRDDVAGGGMPFGSPLPADVVEAFGRWIDAGAPHDGVVAGSEALFVPCH